MFSLLFVFFCLLYKHSVVIPFRMEVKYILVMFTQIQISLRKPEKMRYFGVRFSSLFCLIVTKLNFLVLQSRLFLNEFFKIVLTTGCGLSIN